MSDCLFCKITSGEFDTEFLYEDEHIVTFKDINPKANIHLLVVPKIHIADLSEIDNSHTTLMQHLNF